MNVNCQSPSHSLEYRLLRDSVKKGAQQNFVLIALFVNRTRQKCLPSCLDFTVVAKSLELACLLGSEIYVVACEHVNFVARLASGQAYCNL